MNALVLDRCLLGMAGWLPTPAPDEGLPARRRPILGAIDASVRTRYGFGMRTGARAARAHGVRPSRAGPRAARLEVCTGDGRGERSGNLGECHSGGSAFRSCRGERCCVCDEWRAASGATDVALRLASSGRCGRRVCNA
jgi:hypothetical protein